jgi:hypothetical protein
MALINREELLNAFGLSEKTRKYGGDHSGYSTLMLYEIQNTIEDAKTVEAIPVDYLNSRINDFRQRGNYAGRFAADCLQAIINDYNKEIHND